VGSRSSLNVVENGKFIPMLGIKTLIAWSSSLWAAQAMDWGGMTYVNCKLKNQHLCVASCCIALI